MDLADKLMQAGIYGFGEIGKLDKDKILEREVFESIFAEEDTVARTNLIVQLQQKARELGVIRSFDKLLKAYQTDFVQKYKQTGSKVMQFTNSPIANLKCGEWDCKDTEIYKTSIKANFEPQKLLACSHPIMPIERLINIDTSTEKIKLAFYKDNRWQNVIAERNTIASKNKILQLANRGIEINENNAKELITYLADVITLNVKEIPVNKGITHLGWVLDNYNEFVPFTAEYKYDGDLSFESVFNSVKEKGDYEHWKKELRELRNKSKLLHILVAASFASVLIQPLSLLPFIVHIWGGTGTGKTVGLMVAMSVWGNPAMGKLVKTLNSTNVAFARTAAFLKNIPFAADELQIIKQRDENFDKKIMYLCEGTDKGRGRAEGGVEEIREWNCCFLFSGEEPITKNNSGGGVKNRVIEIETTEKIIENGNYIANFVRENYGFAGKEFVTNLPEKSKLIERFSEIMEALLKQYNTTDKQAMAMSVILLADELSTDLIFKDEKLVFEDVKDFLNNEKEVNNSDRAYAAILDWININKNKFSESSVGEIWGELKDNYCLIYPSKLFEFLNSQGFNFDAIKKKLAQDGKIERDSKGKYTISTPINQKQSRVIKIMLVNEDVKEKEILF